MTPLELEIPRDFQRQNTYQLNLLNPLTNFFCIRIERIELMKSIGQQPVRPVSCRENLGLASFVGALSLRISSAPRNFPASPSVRA